MNKENLINNLQSILETPTAPFHEYMVREKIIDLLSGYKNVEVRSDVFGNLIVHVGPKNKTPKWVFGAHMDHPGYVKWPGDAEKNIEKFRERGDYVFLGGVPEVYFKNEFPIKDYGDFAMWDLLPFKIEGDLVRSRACDDLIGCVAIITLIQMLSTSSSTNSFGAVFTRAEEVGFVGAIELAKSWPFEKGASFVSIETSIPTGKSKIGKGPICRVGDRLTVFDNNLTESILFAGEQRSLTIQRELLNLGACEASAMSIYGVPVAGISLPLGNYHNCGDLNAIEEEFVSFGDLETLINLMLSVVECFPDGPNEEIYKSKKLSDFEKREDKYREIIGETSIHFKKNSA